MPSLLSLFFLFSLSLCQSIDHPQTSSTSLALACFKEDRRCLQCNNPTSCGICYYNQIDTKREGEDGRRVDVCSNRANSIPHCMKEYVEGGETTCRQCDNGYYEEGNACVKGSVEHCLTYSRSTVNLSKVFCTSCGDNRYPLHNVDKCEPLPKNLIIPHCSIHDFQVHTVDNAQVNKTACLLCNQGYSFNPDKECIKECLPGCMECDKANNCIGCDTNRMFFANDTGKCHKIDLPEGNSNSLERGLILLFGDFKYAVVFLLVLGFF